MCPTAQNAIKLVNVPEQTGWHWAARLSGLFSATEFQQSSEAKKMPRQFWNYHHETPTV